jgi:hypothetical protein
MSENSNGLRSNLNLKPDNPFYIIGQELGFLSSGVGLSVNARLDGQTTGMSMMDGMGEGSRGREWLRIAQRVKGFVESSDESE